jgi:hypothetical protein
VTFNLSDCVSAISDNCSQSIDPDVAGQILSVYSDEPEDATGNGDGATLEDIVILGNSQVQIRAEREGTGNGRVYGITFAIPDNAGNSAEAVCTIGVPHDQSGAAPVDDGPTAGYTVP